MSETQKVALVTGAGSGIGRATADAFIASGYAVVLVDRDEAQGAKAREELSKRGECIFLACDVADERSVESAVARAVETYGHVDAAFNGAGVDGEVAQTADASTDNWDRIMAVNLRGVWFCMKYELRQMLEQGKGAIVNCSSSSGLVGTPGMSAYAAAKHGVIGLTKTAALEYARSNIRVNAVCPGMTDTPMWQRSITPEMTEQLLANDPSGRLARPEEIAQAVVWLCAESASFVTGQSLAVDGGMTAD